jgi:hypothetical protein
MSPPTLGGRYLAACEALGVEPWHSGMSAVMTRSSANTWPSLLCSAEGREYARTMGWMPDLSHAATMGAALGVYDTVRGRSAPDPVYLRASLHGLTSPEAQLALVEALERLAAERPAGGTP